MDILIITLVLLITGIIIWGFFRYRTTDNKNQEILDKYLASKRKSASDLKKAK